MLRTFEPWIANPLPALALGIPLEPIDGRQPSEFTFAVQYVAGSGQSNAVRPTTAFVPMMSSTKRVPAGGAGAAATFAASSPHPMTAPSERTAPETPSPAAITV